MIRIVDDIKVILTPLGTPKLKELITGKNSKTPNRKRKSYISFNKQAKNNGIKTNNTITNNTKASNNQEKFPVERTIQRKQLNSSINNSNKSRTQTNFCLFKTVTNSKKNLKNCHNNKNLKNLLNAKNYKNVKFNKEFKDIKAKSKLVINEKRKMNLTLNKGFHFINHRNRNSKSLENTFTINNRNQISTQKKCNENIRNNNICRTKSSPMDPLE